MIRDGIIAKIKEAGHTPTYVKATAEPILPPPGTVPWPEFLNWNITVDYAYIVEHESPIDAIVVVAIIVALLVAFGLIQLFAPAIYRYIGMTPEDVAAYKSAMPTSPFEQLVWIVGGVAVIAIVITILPAVIKRK